MNTKGLALETDMGMRHQAGGWAEPLGPVICLSYKAQSHKVKKYRRYLAPIRMTTIKQNKTLNPENSNCETVEKLEPLCAVGGNVNSIAATENSSSKS